VTVSLRAATYSHSAIAARKAFTANIPSEDHWREADHVGTVSGRDVDKFESTGLTPVRSEHVDAPYVKEFPMVVECKLIETHELGLHTQYIGQVMNVQIEEGCLDEKGDVIVDRLRPIAFFPGPTVYHGIGGFLGDGYSNRELGTDEER
jgi:flavin reductase (DIM6/NTAB) family NADH-FMN oxidoreductase RutF